ncbi:MAG: metallophosphoesterase family protein [Chloroflexota bacterium]
MRIAAIYDIHGNLPALEAVLQDIDDKSVDHLLVGGDVVAGPMPSETLTLLQAVDIPTHFIRGNAESEVIRHINGQTPGGLSELADEEAYWVAKVLTTEHKQFITSWTETHEIEINGLGTVLFCHATPNSDVTVFTRLTPEEKIAPTFAPISASLVVCGHTHMQFDRMIGGIRVVNAGSVGMPFGQTGASWLLIGDDVEMMHTDYDLEKAAERIRQSGYPHAEDFAENNILQAPSEADAMEMLLRLELS